MTTQEKIQLLFSSFASFLSEKNKRYGNSALDPVKVFSKTEVDNQLLTQIDHKLSRIKNSSELRKNDVCDLFGYIALLMIKNDWYNFEEFLD